MSTQPSLSHADQVTALGSVVLCVKADRVQVDSRLPTRKADLLKMGRNLQLIMMEIEERLHATGSQL